MVFTERLRLGVLDRLGADRDTIERDEVEGAARLLLTTRGDELLEIEEVLGDDLALGAAPLDFPLSPRVFLDRTGSARRANVKASDIRVILALSRNFMVSIISLLTAQFLSRRQASLSTDK
jgi:hypothetical protein